MERIHSMILRSAQVQSTTRRAKYVAPAFTGVLGVIFAAYGYWREGEAGFLFLLGVAFIIYSVVVFLANRRAWGSAPPDRGHNP